MRYSVIIRAYELTPLLVQVIEAVKDQTLQPGEIIIVDSSRDGQLQHAFPTGGVKFVRYPEESFNYSKAINIGVDAATQPYTLVLSSHMLIRSANLVEKGWLEAADRGVEIVYWDLSRDASLSYRAIEINKRCFTGRNGLSNSLALIPTQLLRDRPFREEVFSAEDQEWSRYYLDRFGRPILRIETNDIDYLNPNHGETVWSEIKLMNEELAIGHFVNRRLIMPDRIAHRFLRGVLATLRRRPERARAHFRFAHAMFMANFWRPEGKSRYF